MSKSSLPQDLAVLMKSKNGLVYLTTNDWALVADKATRQKFKAGDLLVQKGRRTHGIFILLSGSATAQLSAQGGLRNVGPGEVCGEISFLDELPATANVVANSAVEAFYLDRLTLQSLIELFPHLGSRFYHSLAGILSYRLREVLGSQGGLDDVPGLPSTSKKSSK
jgi:CRP-like cAMP-binding protein